MEAQEASHRPLGSPASSDLFFLEKGKGTV